MTLCKEVTEKRFKILKSFFVLALFWALSFWGSEHISEAVLSGLEFSVTVIVPSVFPFMVLSDFAGSLFEFEKSNCLSKIFERAFKINPCAISMFFAGLIGGFPVGARGALNLYEDGKISKSECERLMSFSNIASPAYTISAVGTGLLSNIKLGIILYSTLIVSAVVTGYLLSINKDYINNTEFISRQKYDFVSSIKSTASACVNLIFFISFFSAICATIQKMRLSTVIKSIICSLFEVSNSVSYISDLCIYSEKLKLAIIAFSLSFSGICVILQSLAFSKKCVFSIQKFVFYKLIQGGISFIIIILLPI